MKLKSWIKKGVCLKFLGNLSQFDDVLMKNIKAAEAQTASNNVIQLNVMLNYGARREIIDAVVSYAQDGGHWMNCQRMCFHRIYIRQEFQIQMC